MKKLLTSSSPSSYSSTPSSSSTLSFNPTLCNSKSGCLTSILHRILCSGALQTHPSDQIIELGSSMSVVSGKVQEFKAMQNTEAANSTKISPGVVGRLMGLDSMGEVQKPSEANPSSLSRSRSMNSVDYLGECKRMEGLHRRVKSSSSSSSFSEVPSFHLLENENFLVLSFESGCESKEFKSKGRRKGLKKNKREKVSGMSCVNVGNGGEVQFATNMKHMEGANGEKVKKRKKGTAAFYNTEKKVESECSSEDSSPVSVFDFERDAPRTDVDIFGDDMNWRRKLSPELENDQHFILHSDGIFMNEERKINEIENSKHEGPKNKEKQSQEFVHIWGEICRLVEDELVRSNQLQEVMRKQGDFGSISADLESEIFDHLLNELVDQLVGNPLKALQL